MNATLLTVIFLFTPLPEPIETAELVRAEDRSFNFSEQGLKTAIRNWIEAQSPESGFLRAERLFVPKVTRPPRGKVNILVRPRGNRSLVGRISLFVDIRKGGETMRTVAVQVETSLETLTARLKQDVQRGAPLSENLIEWEVQRLERLTAPLITPENFAGLQARNMLRAGTLLTQRQVQTIPMVERNQLVLVSVTNSGMTVSMRALALQTGGEGDIIRLKNLDSNQIFTGRVTGPAEIRLEL